MSARHLEAIEAEKSVLGGIMLDNAAVDVVAGILTAEDMFDPRRAVMLGAMLDLSERGEPIDPVTMLQLLEQRGTLPAAGGLEYVLEAADWAATAVNIEHHARIVANQADARRLVTTLDAVRAQAVGGDYDNVAGLLSGAQEAVGAVGSDRAGSSFTTAKVALRGAIEGIQAAYERGSAIVGTPTGLVELDGVLSGLNPGKLIVLAARPAMGKTALALNIGAHVANNGAGVAVFSLEMVEYELAARLLAADSRVDSGRMKNGQLTDGDIDRLLMSTKRLGGMAMHIDDASTASVATIRAKCRSLAASLAKTDTPLRLAVIDYLQLMQGPGERREQEVAGISRGLKMLAKDLGVTVLLLAQLNRSVESRPDKRPLMSDLRESGAIEQDADAVVFIYRDDYYNEDSDARGIAEILVRKNRGGPTATVKLKWTAPITRFDNLAARDR